MKKAIIVVMLSVVSALAQDVPAKQVKPGKFQNGTYEFPGNVKASSVSVDTTLLPNLATLAPTGTSSPASTVVGSVWHRSTTELPFAGEISVVYEQNAKVLAVPASTYVFKGWGSCADNANSMCYAESLTADGTWTLYSSNPVVTGHSRAYVVHSGATYYMSATTMPVSTAIDMYTSSDGLSWTQAATNIIPLGGAGTWNASSFGNTSFVYTGSQWLMLVEATGAPGGANVWTIGAYTAASPTGTWTAYGSNPVLGTAGAQGAAGVLVAACPQILLIDGTFWAWIGGNNSNTDLPTNIIRYKSADGLHWTQDPPGFTFRRGNPNEGVGSYYGQVADPHLVEANGKTYMFYTGLPDGRAGGDQYVASANMPLSQLVTTDEGAFSNGGGMVYPAGLPNGIPSITGSQDGWGTTYSTSGSGTRVALTDTPTIKTPVITGTETIQSADASSAATAILNDLGGNQQAITTYRAAGVSKFLVGKQTDNSFLMYDVPNSASFLTVGTDGKVQIGESNQIQITKTGAMTAVGGFTMTGGSFKINGWTFTWPTVNEQVVAETGTFVAGHVPVFNSTQGDLKDGIEFARNIVQLSAGTYTVSTASACTPAATCIYQLTNCGANSPGVLSVGTVVASTSFVINSSNASDTSYVCWTIIK